MAHSFLHLPLYMNLLRMKGIILLLFSLLTATLALGQKTQSQLTANETYRSGIDLLLKKKYEASRKAFQQYVAMEPNGQRSAEAQYYLAFTALQLFHPDAEQQYLVFRQSFPESPLNKRSAYDLGNFYFQQKRFDKAIRYYGRIEPGDLKPEEEQEAQFKQGYSYFSQKSFDESAIIFNRLKQLPGHYQSQSCYYASYLNLRNGKLDEALADINCAERDTSLVSTSTLLKANILFRKKDYNQVIAIGEKSVRNGAKLEGLDDFSMLLGQCYFHKKDYKTAGQYFDQYSRMAKGALPFPLQYQISFTLFKNGQPAKALEGFRSIAAKPDTAKGKVDSLAQSAAYYLGVCYLETDKKAFALMAFQQAANMNGHAGINESAWFYYGKIAYDLQRYAETVDELKGFLEEYPKTEYAQEASELITESLLNSNNPDGALDYIEKSKVKTPRLNAALQRVAFAKGIQAFNQDDFAGATNYLSRSLNANVDAEVTMQARFWNAEALSGLKNYPKAIEEYQKAVNMPEAAKHPDGIKAWYGLGYALYNNKEYEKAISPFEKYIRKLDDAKVNWNYADALLRMADCQYAIKRYNEALANYDKAINKRTFDTDYALYQKGVIQALNGDTETARISFSGVIEKFPQSKYYDQSLFQRAQLDFNAGNYERAVESFSFIINNVPKGAITPYCYLKRAVAQSNLKNYEAAVRDYKYLLNEYSSHKTANSALLGLQEALVNTGNVEEFSEYIVKFKKANPESDALESVEFETNKNLYFSQKYQKAIKGFEDYLKNYPDNPFKLDAKYYLGDSYNRVGERAKAIETLKEVVAAGKGANWPKALARLADLEFSGANYTSAMRYYLTLLSSTRSRKDQATALTGLMNCYYQSGKADSANFYAVEILKREGMQQDAMNQASLVQSKIALEAKDDEKALEMLLNVVNEAKDVNGAEAQYLIAEMLYKQGKFNESLAACHAFNNQFAQYSKWYNKTFLLLADNYLGLKQTYQAQATLKSIIDNAKDNETKEQARLKLAGIKSGNKEPAEPTP